jgi:ABC-type dipeptide/oligopeptide/nickel transport system ATPase component
MRKQIMLYTLNELVEDDVLTDKQAQFLIKRLKQNKGIIIVGKSGSGKSVLKEALYNEVGVTDYTKSCLTFDEILNSKQLIIEMIENSCIECVENIQTMQSAKEILKKYTTFVHMVYESKALAYNYHVKTIVCYD